MSRYIKKNYPNIPCIVCGTPFKPRAHNGKHCSNACARETQAKYSAEWYMSHRTSELAFRKKYMKAWRLKYPGQTYMKCTTSLYHGAKERAAKSGIEFSITPFDIVVPEICPVLNVKMQRPGRYAPSLDRIDTSKGYTPENIWVISKLANRMKNDSNPDELRRFAEWAINRSTP